MRPVKSRVSRYGSASPVEHPAQRRAAQLGLGDEPPRDASATRGRSRSAPGSTPARRPGRAVRGERLGDGEPVVPGQLHVEQHDVRAQVVGRDEGVGTVAGLAHDVEPVGDQHMWASARNGAWSSTMSTRTAMPRCSPQPRRTHHRVNPAARPGSARYCAAAVAQDQFARRPSRDRGARHVIDRHLDPAAPPGRVLRSHLPPVWWSWPFYALGLAPTAFFACGPLVAALVVIGVTEGRAGYRDLGARMIRWRVGWMWWLVARGHAARRPGRRRGRERRDLGRAGTRPGRDGVVADRRSASAVRFVNPLDGPLGEEPGWRGYALPQLQADAPRWSSGARPRRCSSRSGTCRWWRPAARAGRAADHVRDHAGLRVAVQPHRRQRPDDDGVPRRPGHGQLRRARLHRRRRRADGLARRRALVRARPRRGRARPPGVAGRAPRPPRPSGG